MVMKNIFLLSLFISFFLMASINLYTGGSPASEINKAFLETENMKNGQEVVSFAFGNLILYLVMAGVIYLFLRGIVKSFENTKRKQ